MDVKYLVVHCSATSPPQKVNAEIIDRWHRQRGFRKIGYHRVILRNGTVEEGRDLDEIGAHAEGFNAVSIGICLVGGVDVNNKPEQNFTPPQYRALRSTLRYLLKLYPKAEILGHRDLPGVRKACPSFDVRAWWEQLNNGSEV